MPHYRCPGCGVVNTGPKATKCVGDKCNGVTLVEQTEAELSAYQARNIRLELLQEALADMLQRHHYSECMHCHQATPCRPCVSPAHECHTVAYRALLEPLA